MPLRCSRAATVTALVSDADGSSSCQVQPNTSPPLRLYTRDWNHCTNAVSRSGVHSWCTAEKLRRASAMDGTVVAASGAYLAADDMEGEGGGARQAEKQATWGLAANWHVHVEISSPSLPIGTTKSSGAPQKPR